MRVLYSILKEIRKGISLPKAEDYGFKQREFEHTIFFLEKEGLLERVLRIDTFFSLKPAKLTKKGHEFLESNKQLEESYPARKDIIKWIQEEKEMYSNGAEED